MDSIRRRLGKGAPVASGIVIGILLAEIILRIIGFSYPAFFRKDPILGFAFQPGARGWWHAEGGAYVRINNLGYRGEDYSLDKPENTVRIALLGDSFIAGLAVDEDSTVAASLQREASRCSLLAGKEVECMNFGVVGYGTGQELLVFRHHVSRFAPDIVVLCICIGNDIRNNSRTLSPPEPRPYFLLDGDGLILDESFKAGWAPEGSKWRFRKVLLAATNRSRILQVVRRAKHRIAYLAHSRKVPADSDVMEDELGLDLHVFGPPPGREWGEAWEITERLIEELRVEVERTGSRFLVATLCQSAQVRPPEEREELLAQLRVALQDASLFYPERRIRALGDREGFPVLNMAFRFREEADEYGLVFHGFKNGTYGRGHWNERGHRLAGLLLAEDVCRLLQDRPPTIACSDAGPRSRSSTDVGIGQSLPRPMSVRVP